MIWKQIRRLVLSLFVITGLMTSFSASAEVEFNGFLSAGGGALIDDDDFQTYQGFDKDWNTDPDTLFALQVRATLSEKITATGQLIARGNDDYNLEAEWAYINYSVNDNLDIRVGRLRAPFFMYSDFLDVGYAYPWVRPPEQVYRFVFSTVEGFDAIYTSEIGGWDSTLQAYFGRLTDDAGLAGETVDIDLSSFTGINWAMNKNWLTLRATWNQADVDITSPTSLLPLYAALNGAGFGSVANTLEIDQESTSFWGIGANVDYNNWLVISEYTQLLVDDQSLIGEDEAWYITVGKRVNQFTYHLTYQSSETKNDLAFVEAIPSGVAPALDGLKAAVIEAVGSRDTKVVTLGLRYDFAPSTAFKIEIADIDQSGADGMLVSFAVDLVF